MYHYRDLFEAFTLDYQLEGVPGTIMMLRGFNRSLIEAVDVLVEWN